MVRVCPPVSKYISFIFLAQGEGVHPYAPSWTKKNIFSRFLCVRQKRSKINEFLKIKNISLCRKTFWTHFIYTKSPFAPSTIFQCSWFSLSLLYLSISFMIFNFGEEKIRFPGHCSHNLFIFYLFSNIN